MFPSMPWATLDQWSMSASARPHLLFFSLPVASLSLLQLPEGLLFTAECLPLNGRCDRTRHKMGFKGEGGFRAAGVTGFIAGMTGPPPVPPPPHPTPKPDHWMIHEVKCKWRELGMRCVCLPHCCVWASPVSTVFLTLTRKRDDEERGRGGR